MKPKTWSKTAIAAALASAHLGAYALGLGEINVDSNLNQRFSAVIPLSEVTAEDLEGVVITIAPSEAFDRMGIERSDYLNTLRFNLKSDGNRPRIVVSSGQIAREPVLNLLVQARYRGGKITREYTVLLDPPNLPAARPPPPLLAAAPVLPKPVVAAPVRPVAPLAPVIAAAPSRPAPVPAPLPAPLPVVAVKPIPVPPPPAPVMAPPKVESEFFETPLEAQRKAPAAPRAVAVSGASYGPVKPQETLWRVATNIRPDASVSMEQVMLALVEANPDIIRKAITIPKGAVLRVPALNSIVGVSPSVAKQRLADLQAGRKSLAAAPLATAPVAAVPAPAAAAPATKPVVPSVAKAAPAAVPAAQPAPSAAAGSAAVVPVQSAAPSAASASSASATAVPAAPATATHTAPATPPVTKPTAPVTAPSAAVAAGPVVDEQPSWLATNWPLLGGGAAALLLAGFGVMALRRAKPEADATAGGKKTPAAPSAAPARVSTRTTATVSAHRPADTSVTPARVLANDNRPFAAPPAPATAPVADPLAQVDLSQLKAPSTVGGGEQGFESTPVGAAPVAQASVDPIADADFHLAYGGHDQAIDILAKAAVLQPQRLEIQLKLAEALFAARQPEEFLSTAQALRGKVSDADWGKLAMMGGQLVPGSSLFKSASEEAGHTDFDLLLDEVPSSLLGAETTPAPQAPAASVAPVAKVTPPPLEFPGLLATPAAPAPMSADDIDFMLGQSITPLGAGLSLPLMPGQYSDNDLGFNLGSTALNVVSPLSTGTAAPQSATDYEISLQSLQVSLTPREGPPAGADELNTKLDLARAYVEMGDHESARGLLEEVRDSGGALHQQEASALLARLSG